MTITSGSRLGPYEVLAPLGAGGMGEVWRGRDTRLERSVAIKVLPAEFADNAQFKMRFEREAKTISQLNDPHICTLYDVGENYLVMELLEGETLAEKVSRGPLPIEQALRYGMEIAGALEKAHRAGVVHRDLKPGNVMITKSGAKLLDFGLAKPSEGGVMSALTSLRTEKRNLTEEGTIVGTFQYMAPEQIEGGAVDARTDIFALGALLYEMATGRKAFEGKSKASLIASILTAEPQPISAMQPMMPLALDRLVRTCLQKEPDDRWQSAHDVATELRWIAEGVAQPVAGRPRRAWLTRGIIAALLIASAAFAFLWIRATAEPPRRVEASILPPENMELLVTAGSPAVSPDGSWIAYVGLSKSDAKAHLFVRNLANGAVQELAMGLFPFWSPDSRAVAFFDTADRKLKRVDVTGGSPQVICDFDGRGIAGTWNPDGVIVFAPGGRHGLQRVAASGGTPVDVTRLDLAHETSHRFPSFLPDGKHFLYIANTFELAENGILYVGNIENNERKLVARTGWPSVYANGHLFYCRDRILVAQPFDLKALELRGEPRVIADNIYTSGTFGFAAFSISRDGVLSYVRGSGERSHFVWHDRSGKQLGVLLEPGDYQRPSLSHDGRHLAYEVFALNGKSDIWIYDLVRQTAMRFTSDAGSETNAIWSPDDRYIVYNAEDVQHGVRNIIKRESGGSGNAETLFSSKNIVALTAWSSDGKFIFFHDGFDVFCYSIPDRKITPVVHTPFNDAAGRLSPDGRWLAFQSEQSGHMEIYVQPFPNPTFLTKISLNGGTQPRWTSNGRELIYETLDHKVMAVEIHAGQTFEAGIPKELFAYQFKPGGWPLDVTPDGQRFIVNESVRDESGQAMTLVVNFSVPK